MLRGTKSNARRGTVSVKHHSLQNQLDSVRRQLSRQKPSLEFVRSSFAATSTTGFNTNVFSLTQTIKNSSLYDTIILGDKWTNSYFRYNVHAFASVTKLRIVVYYAKRAGTDFDPTDTATGFTGQLDPAAFVVLSDRVFQPPTTATGLVASANVPLRNRITISNRSNGLTEQGELFMSILSEGTAINGEITVNGIHAIRNK